MVNKQASDAAATRLIVYNKTQVADIRPFGVNIGYHDRFGASQILKNVIVNPGFEAGEFATIVIVAAGGRNWFSADNWQTRWNIDAMEIGQPVDFWNGAEYEAVDGAASGRAGRIAYFTHENGRYTFYTNNHALPFAPGDVVFLRHYAPVKYGDQRLGEPRFHTPDASQRRPGTAGKQSLRLLPPAKAWQWSWSYTMDTFWRDRDRSAGKLLIADGVWRLSFWARGASDHAKLEVSFSREGQTTFLRDATPLGTRWRRISHTIVVPDGSDAAADDANILPAPLVLKLRAVGHEPCWIDDISLERTGQTNPTAFSDRFVARLTQLRPGVLRNWGHQLGCTLDNQLSTQFGRRPSGYNPRQRTVHQFHYSLHQFLELAQTVGANPWYVIPPTFSEQDLHHLIAYLAAPSGAHRYGTLREQLGQAEPWTTVFDTIHLEFGNEMWGSNRGTDPFLGATVRGGERLGRIAAQRLSIMKRSPFYREARRKIDLMIGGQVAFSARQREIEQASRVHDTIALAPYFAHALLPVSAAEQVLRMHAQTLAASDTRSAAQLGSNRFALRDTTRLAIYEINAHTTLQPWFDSAERNALVTGLASALNLTLSMLRHLHNGHVRTQAAFTMLQYAFELTGGKSGELVNLWGLLRDVEATERARPGWQALRLVNRALFGRMLQTTLVKPPHIAIAPNTEHQLPAHTLSAIHVFATHDDNRYRIVLFNLDLDQPHTLSIELPVLPLSRATLWRLVNRPMVDSPYGGNNESAEQIQQIEIELTDFDQNYHLQLPPQSLTIIEARVFKLFMPMIND